MTQQDALAPALVEVPLDRQRLFVRYFVGILIDLVVLNLFAQYWGERVKLDTCTTSLLARRATTRPGSHNARAAETMTITTCTGDDVRWRAATRGSGHVVPDVPQGAGR